MSNGGRREEGRMERERKRTVGRRDEQLNVVAAIPQRPLPLLLRVQFEEVAALILCLDQAVLGRGEASVELVAELGEGGALREVEALGLTAQTCLDDD